MNRLLIILLAFPLLTGFAHLKGPTEAGNEAFHAGRYDDALEAYLKAAEDYPDKAEAHYNLGGAYYKKGEYDKAFDEYRKAAKLDPKMSDAYYNAGDALYRMGQYEEALKAYRQADSLKKGDKDTAHNITITLNRIKKEEEKKQRQGRGQGPGARGQGSGGRGSQPPSMSNEEAQALLDRQKEEEKRLRNFFQPGRANRPDREGEIEQMLRGLGMAHEARPVRPGAPHVEKDW